LLQTARFSATRLIKKLPTFWVRRNLLSTVAEPTVIEAFTDLEILLEIQFPVEILLVHGFLEKTSAGNSCSECWPDDELMKRESSEQLELELIQTQMTQKPMLRAEVYARALRASQNRKEDSV